MTSVGSSAGRPSTGWYCENPVRCAACLQTGSLRFPSMTTELSIRGISTLMGFARPSYTSVESVASAIASTKGSNWLYRSLATREDKHSTDNDGGHADV